MNDHEKVQSRFAQVADWARVTATVAALKANGFDAEAVDTAATARARVLELVPPGSRVFTGSSRTLEETGIATEVDQSGLFDAIRPKLVALSPGQQRREIKTLTAVPEIVLGSCQAITDDGRIMVASGTGSQLSHYAFAADKVILVVGTQKLVRDEAEGLARIEGYCFPLEDERVMGLMGFHSTIAKVLTIRRDMPGRVTVIMVRQNLGF